MAKQPRKNLTLFGGSGATGNFGQFGSQAASAPLTTKDIDTIQLLGAWANGWQDAVALGNAPYLQDMNSAMYVAFYELFYLFQEGIPEWNTNTTYWIGSYVKKTGTNELYASLIDNNTANALPSATSDANWKYMGALLLSGGTLNGSLAFTNYATQGITGTATNNDAAAGKVGEYLRGYGSGVNCVNGQFVDITSINLTAGDWDVSGIMLFRKSTSTPTGSCAAASFRRDVRTLWIMHGL